MRRHRQSLFARAMQRFVFVSTILNEEGLFASSSCSESYITSSEWL